MPNDLKPYHLSIITFCLSFQVKDFLLWTVKTKYFRNTGAENLNSEVETQCNKSEQTCSRVFINLLSAQFETAN